MKSSKFLVAVVLTLDLMLPTLALAACSGTACVVNDPFSRSVSTGWGTASTGGTYSLKWFDDGTSAAAQGFVGSGEGEMSTSAAGDVEAVTATIGSTSYTDTDTVATVEFGQNPTGAANVMAGVVARSQGYDQFYTAELDITNNKFVVYSVVSPSTFWSDFLSQSNLSPALQTNTYYKIRFRVVGNTFKAKYWLASQSEPSTWNLEGTDPDAWYSSGKPGLLNLTNATGGSGVDMYYDNFQVKDCTIDTCDAASSF